MSYGQTVTHVTASQAASGAGKAAKLLNQVNADGEYTSFGRKPVAAPKPVAVQSPAHGAAELIKLQGEWNNLCNLFGWKGRGGKSRARKTRFRSRTPGRGRARGRTRTRRGKKNSKRRVGRSGKKATATRRRRRHR